MDEVTYLSVLRGIQEKGAILKLESTIKRGQVLHQAAFEVVTSSNKSWHVPTKSPIMAPELTEERSVWQAL